MAPQQDKDVVLVIHGGTGKLMDGPTPPEKEKVYTDKFAEALQAGFKIINEGGKSLDAVEAAIIILEDSPLFNSGKGSVFTNEDVNELDASIMEGHTFNAGSVAGVRTIKNPITAAKAVMEHSAHVMLTGAGADKFASEQGLEIVDNSYFRIEERWQQHLAFKAETEKEPSKYGTVGAVSLDKHKHIAAGTSTGGMINKKYGRVGDSPIIGAGTYANKVAGVSCTGHGEYFIRAGVAGTICNLMEYKPAPINDIANTIIHEKLKHIGGVGGSIALDVAGNLATPFSSEGMLYAYIKANGDMHFHICNMIIS